MTLLPPSSMAVDPGWAAPFLADLGFLSKADLPDRPGPAYLLVAIRETPTRRHFDPEAVHYWVSVAGRGQRRVLTRRAWLPVDAEFSWGVIRIVDRLDVTNEYFTFGGRVCADDVDGTVIATFTSPAPLLRRGGHSQGWDEGAESLGAFFGRFLLAVDYVPGFEGLAADAEPITRYAAFVADTMARYRANAGLRSRHAELWTLLQAEERRLRRSDPASWTAGEGLRRAACP